MKTEILFFSAPWCGPCQQMKNLLKESNLEDLQVRVIDITEKESIDIAIKHNVLSVPLFVKLEDDKEVSRKSGAISINDLKIL